MPPKQSQKQRQTVIVNIGDKVVKRKRKRKPRAKKQTAPAPATAGSVSPLATGQEQNFARFIYPVQVLPKENPLITDELKAYLKLLHGGQQAAPPMLTAPPPQTTPLMITEPEEEVKPPSSIKTKAPQSERPLITLLSTSKKTKPDVSLGDMASLKQVEEVVKKGEKAPSLYGSSIDIDELLGGGKAAAEPEGEQEKKVLEALEVEAHGAAEKARKKLRLVEGELMPPTGTKPAKKKPLTAEEKRRIKEEKAVEKARKEDEGASFKAAKIHSGTGGFISRGFT